MISTAIAATVRPDADLARAYNDGWFDRGAHLGGNRRTSRLIEPPNGRFPAMTPGAAAKYKELHAWLAQHADDGPETRTLYDRCLVFSQSGPPFIPGNYNNFYQIVQAPVVVAILSEMGHQLRAVPLTNGTPSQRSHPPESVRQWEGDSLGHWERETLVIETTNFRGGIQNRFGVQYDGMTDENLRVTERFTRTVQTRLPTALPLSIPPCTRSPGRWSCLWRGPKARCTNTPATKAITAWRGFYRARARRKKPH